MARFIPVDRDTQFLFPPSVQEWLPEDHLARFIVDIVEQLDLSALEESYAGRGSDAHHPVMLVALLLYGYATGTFSSRALERASSDSIAFRYIAANTHPDHDTINSSRKRFLKQIEAIFVQVLCYAQAMGILKLGTLSVDGTKVHANASRHSAMSYGHAKKLEAKLKAEVAELMKRAEAANAKDLPEGMNLHEELRRGEQRLAAIPAAKAKLEARGKAEAGYASEDNVNACAQAKIEPLIALGREAHHGSLFDRFAEPAPLHGKPTPLAAMRHRLQTRRGCKLYALRKCTVEPVFGLIKQVMKFRQFLLRGLTGARGKWRLVCLAWNLKRMNALCA